MRRKNTLFIGGLLLLSFFYTWYEATRPQPLDWSVRYLPTEKNPYDTYIVKRSLDWIFPSSKIISTRQPLMEQLGKLPDGVPVSYIFINGHFRLNPVERKSLLEFVSRGNLVFVASGFTLDSIWSCLGTEQVAVYESQNHRFILSGLSGRKYGLDKSGGSYFTFEKDFKQQTLGVFEHEHKERPDFIKIPYGRGEFFFNLNPKAFTNYFVLDSLDGDYYYKALSFLPDRGGIVVWDENQTLGMEESDTPLRVIFQHPALRWALYLLLFGGLMYALFSMKREQRPVPVIRPYENRMLGFIAAVSSLFYKQKSHRQIALKRIDFFMERVRGRYLLRTDVLDESFIKQLSVLSGNDVRKIAGLVDFIKAIRKAGEVTGDELKRLVKEIESINV